MRPGTHSITLQRDGQQLKGSGITIQAGKLTRVVVKGKAGAVSLEVKAPVADGGAGGRPRLSGSTAMLIANSAAATSSEQSPPAGRRGPVTLP